VKFSQSQSQGPSQYSQPEESIPTTTINLNISININNENMSQQNDSFFLSQNNMKSINSPEIDQGMLKMSVTKTKTFSPIILSKNY